ncbi:MoaD/ThiS family protein [Sphingobacterium suaedae]|uniref:Molybdopterin synthase sulfur carrier subunit n=1 Tax=Sphingobacterium suaedae TaxID=1686402 RepID=A0ABW5KHR3_9SPHI
MKVKVLTFGITKEIVGDTRVELELVDDSTVSDLKNRLELLYPALRTLKSYFIAINDEYASIDQRLLSSDEIAIIPPVSGG